MSIELNKLLPVHLIPKNLLKDFYFPCQKQKQKQKQKQNKEKFCQRSKIFFGNQKTVICKDVTEKKKLTKRRKYKKRKSKFSKGLMLIKVYYPGNKEIRIFTPKSYDDLKYLVFSNKGYKEEEMYFQYLDKELDWITFNSQIEWEEAINVHKELKLLNPRENKFLRIKLRNKSNLEGNKSNKKNKKKKKCDDKDDEKFNVKDDIKYDIKNDIKDNVKDDIKGDIKYDIQNDIKDDGPVSPICKFTSIINPIFNWNFACQKNEHFKKHFNFLKQIAQQQTQSFGPIDLIKQPKQIEVIA